MVQFSLCLCRPYWRTFRKASHVIFLKNLFCDGIDICMLYQSIHTIQCQDCESRDFLDSLLSFLLIAYLKGIIMIQFQDDKFNIWLQKKTTFQNYWVGWTFIVKFEQPLHKLSMYMKIRCFYPLHTVLKNITTSWRQPYRCSYR